MRRYRTLLIALLVLATAGAVGGFPLLREEAATMCIALETRLVPIPTAGSSAYLDQMTAKLAAVFLKGIQQVSQGAVAKELARQAHPGWPVEVACGVEYWRSFLPKEKGSG
jgi:hypothetical protein